MLKKLQNISIYWYFLLIFTVFFVSELLVSIYGDPCKLNYVIAWFALPLEGWEQSLENLSSQWQLWRYLTYVFVSRTLLSFVIEAVCLYLLVDGLRNFCSNSEIASVFIYSALLSGILCRILGFWIDGVYWLYGSAAGFLGLWGYLCVLMKEDILHVWLIVMIPVKAKALWIITLIGILLAVFYGRFFAGLSDLLGFFTGSFLAYRFSDKMDVQKLYLSLKGFVSRKYLKYRRRHLHSLKPQSLAASADTPPESAKRPSSGSNAYLDSIMKKLAEEGSKALSAEEKAFLDSVTLKKK